MTQTRGRHARWSLAVLLTSLFMTQLDTTIVNVATPSIHSGLRASGSALQLVVSGYILTYAMLLITGARLGDLRGYRRVFLGGLGLFTLASLACGVAPTALTLILARLVQGVGAALMVPQVLSGIQLTFSGSARPRPRPLPGGALRRRRRRSSPGRRARLRQPVRRRLAPDLLDQRADRSRARGRRPVGPAR